MYGIARLFSIAALIVATTSSIAVAEIEKFADSGCENGLCFYWWPKLPAVPGWHQETESSRKLTSNILAPDGSNFADAETVMYARALYKPRMPEVKSLDEFIAKDKADTARELPGTTVADAAPLTNGDGKVLRTVTFSPPENPSGSWERLAYAEEDEFYLLFTISSHSKEGLAKSMKDFERLIASYKAKP